EILDYTLSDFNYVNSNGENRKIAGVTFIPNSGNDVVAILDIPAEASYLKEFFDVRLHIVNNASSEFTLEKNEVVFNVPEGMTMMTSLDNGYNTSKTVYIDSIKGQETKTLSWVLRGDKVGEYNLSADFTGTLAEFNELVTAHFETEEPIKVYGLNGVKFRILTADEIHNDTLYFNVEFENQRDIDIYMPSIGVTEKIANVTESVLNNNVKGDFVAEAYILNVYLQNENGEKQYIPFRYDENGKVITSVETLTPGQKLVYEYVAYNAINYDGVAYFKNAAIKEFEGVIDNIETGSFHKELYSFTDYSEKLDKILSNTNSKLSSAIDYITSNENYYYVNDAISTKNSVCEELYKSASLVFNADVSVFTREEEVALIKQIILSILSDSSVIDEVENLVNAKYTEAIEDMLKKVESKLISNYFDDKETQKEIIDAFSEIAKDTVKLVTVYRTEGPKKFREELSKRLLGYSIGITVDLNSVLLDTDEIVSFSKVFDTGKSVVEAFLKASSVTERDAYYYSVLKQQCNADVCNYILDQIIENTKEDFNQTIQDLVLKGALVTIPGALPTYELISLLSTDEDVDNLKTLIYIIASDMKKQVNDNMDEFYAELSYTVNLIESTSELAVKEGLKLLMKKCIGSTLLAFFKAGFSVLDAAFGWESYVKQIDCLQVYYSLSNIFVDAFYSNSTVRNSKSDYYSMLYLRAACELRLDGESQYISFMQDYLDGVYLRKRDEQEILNKINKSMNTGYETVDEWRDIVQYNIVSSRDSLFNKEQLDFLKTPKAPTVTLDYTTLKTTQSFSSEYEYCFADGVWKSCENAPISFTVGRVPSTLRVRKAASDNNFVGDITTVRIYARKDLSKLITVKFDGVNYLFNNLSSKYNYQVVFTNNQNDSLNWNNAKTILGSNSEVKVSGVKEFSYVYIRSCTNPSLYETNSNPLGLTVGKKQPLNLVIDGSGTVIQSNKNGCYFSGDSINLTATANTGNEFKGWYINGICVSTDEHYIVEMADNLKITALFTGAKLQDISVKKSPTKLSYFEGEDLDLSQFELLATYSDGSTKVVEGYSAYIASNEVGKSSVVVNYGGLITNFNIEITHNESDWIILDNPTHIYDGLKVKKCNMCGEILESVVMPRLENKTEASEQVKPSMLCGASIRLSNVNGIRFYTQVDTEKIESLRKAGYTIKLGTLIGPKDLIGEDLDFNDVISGKAVDIKFESNEYYVEGDFKGVVGSIANIKEKNISRNYVGRGYIEITDADGVSTMLYASYENENINNNSRSLQYISKAIIADERESSQLIYEKYRELIDAWSEGKAA
ncbi:MAG: hypothetical protein IJD90_00070, partial [Clostridia bacterium]|nr:hypothetical protein [Clostridia bacterium]